LNEKVTFTRPRESPRYCSAPRSSTGRASPATQAASSRPGSAQRMQRLGFVARRRAMLTVA